MLELRHNHPEVLSAWHNGTPLGDYWEDHPWDAGTTVEGNDRDVLRIDFTSKQDLTDKWKGRLYLVDWFEQQRKEQGWEGAGELPVRFIESKTIDLRLDGSIETHFIEVVYGPGMHMHLMPRMELRELDEPFQGPDSSRKCAPAILGDLFVERPRS